MKYNTLETWCKSQGYQGGTVFQCIEACNKVTEKHGAYKLAIGYVETERKNGNEPSLLNAFVPYNSFGSPEIQVPEYIKGLLDSGL